LIAKPSKKTTKTYITSTQKKPKANDFQFLKKEKKKGKSLSFLSVIFYLNRELYNIREKT